jgi:integrase
MKRSFKRNPKTGTWSTVVDLPVGLNTARRQKRLYARTNRGLEMLVAQTLTAAQNGTLAGDARMTLGELLDRWLSMKEARVAFRTYGGYADQVRLYLRPTLGQWPVTRLTSAIIQSAIEQWERQPTFDSKAGRRSPRTINCVIMVLSMALEYARKTLRLRPDNPAADVDRPPARAARKPQHLLAAGAGEMLKALKPTRLFLPIFIAFSLGLRRGEILGLQRGDVKVDTSELWIKRAAVARGKVHFLGRPKTKASDRELPLPDVTKALIVKHLEEQERQLKMFGVSACATTPLFDRGDGKPWHPDSFAKLYRRTLKRAKLPHLPLHGTRHSFASIARALHVDRLIVRDTLGHESETLTAKVYTHVHMDAIREATELIARSLVDGLELAS